MRLLLAAALAALVSAPASAFTYDFSYSIGSSGTAGEYFDIGTDTFGTGDILVDGFIETDGTLGAITEANILSWGFTLTGLQFTRSIASTGLLGEGGTGDRITTFARFDATPTTLTPNGDFRFGESDFVFDESDFNIGSTDVEIIRFDGDGENRAEILNRTRSCSGPSGCGNFTLIGEASRDFSPGAVGSTVSAVPLPASGIFLFAALGGLGALRLRRSVVAR
ncbi:MAG: VPLPA-CTERM sorting domain-containing protein [Pseudomonadota bacterium]